MIKWEEIYNSCNESGTIVYQATYRAKVFGGWIVRHETACEYKYTSDENEDIDEEGYQKFSNTITFMPDAEHKWSIEE